MHRRSLLGAAASAAMVAAPVLRHAARAAADPLVLELFTSQGCSSCPPADALLGELARRPGVIALAWHVTYWDGAAWHDPFATPFATDRQRAYARALDDEVYTPALVVNGARMVVGSRREDVAQAIGAAPSLSVPVTFDGAAAEIGAVPGSVTATFVLLEPEHVTRIGGGENGGRSLREFQIVRSARLLGAWSGGPHRIALPEVPKGLGAALLVQASAADRRLLGAAARRAAAAPA